ncbi:MAG: DUF167 domain-containing protein [Firmicutes bacterium]|nr:DUF167 domain-containing protein [Bacillota bacterium]
MPSLNLKIKVITRASKNEISGRRGDSLLVRLKAPPVEGRANKELIDFLAQALYLKKNQIELLQGEKSRNKVVVIKDAPEICLQKLKELEGIEA